MTDQPEGADGVDGDTVLGPAPVDGAPFPLIEPTLADADTIVVTRPGSGRRRSETPTTFTAEPVDGARFALRIGTHPPIPLEVPAYIGRRPSTPRIIGARMPRLVMVPSPSREISGTHVEIRQEGETVVVTDLGSTNGTIVTSGGFPPRGLLQGESVVVGEGCVVDIGDGIRIVVVAAPAETPAEGTR